MKQTFNLKNPILINGNQVSELSYDFNEIDCNSFTLASSYADSKALVATQQGKPSATIMEQNTNLHLYLAMMAIIAVNPDIDITDLERIKGFDLISLSLLGRNFIAGRLEEPSSQKSLEEPSEATPESIIQE